MPPNDAEVAVLKEQVSTLVTTLDRYMDANGKQMERLTEAVTRLAAMEAGHERHDGELRAIRTWQTNANADLGRLNEHEIRIAGLDREMRDIKGTIKEIFAKLDEVFRALPNMVLASGWVFKALTGLAVFSVTIGTAATLAWLKAGAPGA